MCRFRPNSNAHITQQHMSDIYVNVLNVWVCLRVWYSHWAHFWFQPYVIFHSFVIVDSSWCWWYATVTVCECDRVISPCLVKICFIIYLIFLNKTVTWYVSRLSIKMIVNRERVVILVFSCCCCHCCYWRCHFAHSLELQFKFIYIYLYILRGAIRCEFFLVVVLENLHVICICFVAHTPFLHNNNNKIVIIARIIHFTCAKIKLAPRFP